MTSYPRTDEDRPWEEILPVRKWLYQTPEQILIKASNGASDFGNKFGQPLICGSVLTLNTKRKMRFTVTTKSSCLPAVWDTVHNATA